MLFVCPSTYVLSTLSCSPHEVMKSHRSTYFEAGRPRLGFLRGFFDRFKFGHMTEPEDTQNDVVARSRESLPVELRPVLAKINRANEHLENLKTEINAWIGSDPNNIRFDVENDGAKHLAWAEFDPLPDIQRWGLMIGDVLHNLRSGLDHLAWKLVEVSGNTPSRDTAFPIFKISESWGGHSRKRVAGMSKSIVTVIEGMQPYRRGDKAAKTALWILHDLNIRDKHHLVTPVILRSETFSYEIGADATVELTPTLEHKTVFMTIYPVEPTPSVHVKLQMTSHVAIDLGAGRRIEVGKLLTDLRDETSKVLASFVQFF